MPRLILLSGAYLLKKLENNWGNLFQKVKKLLFLLANLICQLKILTYHSIMLTQIINANVNSDYKWQDPYPTGLVEGRVCPYARQ